MTEKSTQRYDTVIKKNLQEILPGLINELLGTNYQSFETANVEIPTTLNKKSDLIFEADADGKHILHIEFQSANDAAMLHRMHLYNALLYYQRPDIDSVRQIVIYVGKSKMRMKDRLEKPGLSFRYQIIDLKQFPYQKFLYSSRVEVALFTLLADLQQEKPETIIQKIIARIKAEAPGAEQLANFLVDLEILARLRNFESIVQQIRRDMFLFDLTKTPIFQEGKQAGKEEGMKEGIAKAVLAMHKNGLSAGQISELIEIPETQVRQIMDKNPARKSAATAKKRTGKK